MNMFIVVGELIAPPSNPVKVKTRKGFTEKSFITVRCRTQIHRSENEFGKEIAQIIYEDIRISVYGFRVEQIMGWCAGDFIKVEGKITGRREKIIGSKTPVNTVTMEASRLENINETKNEEVEILYIPDSTKGTGKSVNGVSPETYRTKVDDLDDEGLDSEYIIEL